MDKKILESLKEEYDKGIPLKLDRVRGLIDSLGRNWSKEDLTALRFEIHKMAGSAGTYGYENVSELSKLTEQIILEELDHFDSATINKELFLKLDPFFESIKKGFYRE